MKHDKSKLRKDIKRGSKGTRPGMTHRMYTREAHLSLRWAELRAGEGESGQPSPVAFEPQTSKELVFALIPAVASLSAVLGIFFADF